MPPLCCEQTGRHSRNARDRSEGDSGNHCDPPLGRCAKLVNLAGRPSFFKMESLAAALRDAKAVYKNETQLTKDLRRAASNRHSGGSRRHSGPLGWPAPAATAQQSCFECHQVQGAQARRSVWCLPAKRTTFAWRSRTAGLPTSHRLLDQIFDLIHSSEVLRNRTATIPTAASGSDCMSCAKLPERMGAKSTCAPTRQKTVFAVRLPRRN